MNQPEGKKADEIDLSAVQSAYLRKGWSLYWSGRRDRSSRRRGLLSY